MNQNDYSAGHDRRKAPRIETDLYGTLTGGPAELRCRIVNVSRLGTCAISPTPIAEMSQVKLRFQTDDAGKPRTLVCEAAVVRCTRRVDGQFDVGLFFVKVADSDRAALDAIIARDAASRVHV